MDIGLYLLLLKGSIPWFVVAEMFTQETRDPAIVITVVVNWIGQIVISLGYPPLLVSYSTFYFLNQLIRDLFLNF